jgi:hypothetical protein
MANLKSTQATNAAYFPIPSADRQAELTPIFADYVLTAGSASGDIIEMIPWPRNTKLVDLYVDTEDLGTTWTADVGVMSGAWGDAGARTCGAEIMTGKAFGTAGVYRADVSGFSMLAAAATDRSIGIKGTTVGTPTAGAKVRVHATFRPLVEGA